jgi:anti-sigma B factor antagonist
MRLRPQIAEADRAAFTREISYHFLMILDVNTRRVEPGITVLELIGRLTLGNRLTEVERFIKETIQQQGCRRLVLDLAKLEFMDSSGVGMLVMCAGAMDHAGGQIRLAGANPRVTQVFEIVHLGRVVQILADAAAACGSFTDAGTATAS